MYRILPDLAAKYGTPLFVVDHAIVRRSYAEFIRCLPRVQAYYAVKANPDAAIAKTLFDAGASFDVASMNEFQIVYELIKAMPPKQRQDWIWDKIIYSNPIKAVEALRALDSYRPLVTYDNIDEVKKIARHAPNAGLVLRLRVPNTGSMVELSSKFGALPSDAIALIDAAHREKLTVEGLSFHVGSQCNNLDNYLQALDICAAVFYDAWSRGWKKLNLLDIGGGFPAPYDANVKPFPDLARRLNSELNRLFPPSVEVVAEPGRFLVATACTLVAGIIGKAVRDGKICYYINDGIYHTYSGILFDHCQYPVKCFKRAEPQTCAVFGQTCDALDTISLAERLPGNLEIGDLVYSENIGAYSHASSTNFNGFPPAKVVHINR